MPEETKTQTMPSGTASSSATASSTNSSQQQINKNNAQSTPSNTPNKIEPKTPANMNNNKQPDNQQKPPNQQNNNNNNNNNNNKNNNQTNNKQENNNNNSAQKQGNNNNNNNQQHNKNQNNNNNNNNKQNGQINRANSNNNMNGTAQKNNQNQNQNNNQNKQQNNNNNNQNKNQNNNKQQQHHQQNRFNQNNSNNNNQGNNQNGNASNRQQDQSNSQQQSEKKFTGRCRLFVGNLPSDITEQEFKDLFAKFGETGECFLNTQRSFGFIKLDTRINAEHAKQELDGFTFKGRCIRVRFASHGAAVRVKNLSPFVSNEYLEQAFSMFGPVERAVVIVDDKGRPTGEGIVEFERKPAASQCINRCTENCFILTSYPKPVIVEPLDQKDDEDGLPEKSIMKNQQYHSEREINAHFAQNNSLELDLALKWRDLYELEKQIKEDGKKKIQEAREQLEYEIEVRLIDYKEQKLKEDLRAKQEELQRIEDLKKTEFQRRKDMEIRRQDDERRRQEEMMLYRKQQESIMMHQQANSRMPQVGLANGPNGNVGQGGVQQNNFDQPLLNQPHMPPVMSEGPGGGMGGGSHGGRNNRYDQSGGQYSQQGQVMPQQLNQLPQQQQAMLAAQLSAFAMAAAGNLNIPGVNLFDQQGQQGPNNMGNNNMNQGGGGGGGNGGGNRGNRGGNDDHRSGGDNRRNFNRRGGGGGNGGGRGQHGNRDDQSPFPGYDNKRPRY